MIDPPDRADPRISRRLLLQAGTGATAILVLDGLGPITPAQAVEVSAYLQRSGYAGLAGTCFLVASGPQLRLAWVGDLERARTEPEFADRDDAFAVTLVGSPGLRAGTHQIRHPRLGSFALFLAPVGPEGQTQEYEIVVDRSVRLAEAIEQAPKPLEHSNAPAAAEGEDQAKKAKRRGVLSGTLARRGGVLSADVRVERERNLTAVQLLLARDDVVLARGFRRLGGRLGVRVNLSERGRVAPGRYWLHATTTDRRGRRATSKLRVTLR